jgi:hypothetical protein
MRADNNLILVNRFKSSRFKNLLGRESGFLELLARFAPFYPVAFFAPQHQQECFGIDGCLAVSSFGHSCISAIDHRSLVSYVGGVSGNEQRLDFFVGARSNISCEYIIAIAV